MGIVMLSSIAHLEKAMKLTLVKILFSKARDIRPTPVSSKLRMEWEMKGDRKGPGPLPPRWLHCPRKATTLIAGKFLAFKTPLDARFDDQVPEECRFYPEMVLESMKSYQVKIALWIDLTYTNRFYNPSFLTSHDVKYCKLECRGHGETPSPNQTKTFIEVCHKYFTHTPDAVIAVHCTHGFNRTGFLIIAYLIEKCDWSVEAALTGFAECRHPGIYKPDYLSELYKRYGDVTDTPPPPPLPDWCHAEDEDFDDDGEVVNGTARFSDLDDHSPASRTMKRRREQLKKTSEFMKGVPGVQALLNWDKVEQIQKKVEEMCEWKWGGFPGSQPVSMDMQNITLLSSEPFKVSWKADGTRYMMLIDGENEVYFIDRDNCIFQVENLTFPCRKGPEKHLNNTLLDGEMVIDESEGNKIPRYLIYDIVRFRGEEVGKTPFNVRLYCIKVSAGRYQYPWEEGIYKRMSGGMLQKEIIETRHQAMMAGTIVRTSESFGLRAKEFYDLNKTRSLLGEKFRSCLSHPPDGLIFQPIHRPYKAGRCDEVLKWKPGSLNSVDFRLQIVEENREGMLKISRGLLYVGRYDEPFAEMRVTRELRQYNKKIIECKYENGQWVFLRERTDKSFPNSLETAKAVCQSIINPVTERFLLNYIDQNYQQSQAQVTVMPRRPAQESEVPPAGKQPHIASHSS
ncbi:unnamed protein product [Darwinula stevensoni]|uniref:mRNA-capping enzyme n=1 Tax=Darwinula stevensoni TaxID=69355 RepID=A0A7R9A5U7_9CRUS|nr:unnamed protein product [Darwinula stevensoni]CAG0887238.1 unnamed protein product [Darwinula stevensoni]